MNSDRTVTLTDVIWRRQTSLLFVPLTIAACLFNGCGAGAPAKPVIPESVSPGWKLRSLNQSVLPAGLAAEGSPSCWKAAYEGEGTVEMWICWYRVPANAFEAVQRARAEAQTVKFQEGSYFVLAKWNNTPKANLTALIRGVQKALQPAR